MCLSVCLSVCLKPTVVRNDWHTDRQTEGIVCQLEGEREAGRDRVMQGTVSGL